jgi:hypothetical protein
LTYTAEELRPIYERNGRNAQRTADEIGVPVTTLKGWKAYREIRSPFIVTGRSTLRNLQTGEDVMVWEKESLDKEREESARQAAFDALASTLPRELPRIGPSLFNADLATVYTLTDAHIGMLAWAREGGEDWDLTIAERVIVGCFAEAIRSAPDSELAIFNQLGDALHYDGLTAVTPTSGHILDADSRFTKMVEVAVRILRRIVGMLLDKHSRVHVIMAEGNHDMASSVWLRTMFKALYELEPRVTVDDSALPYYCYEHGQTMLAFHHSHIKKLDQLRSHIAAQFSEAWGRTRKRYIHTGDKHHSAEKDEMGAKLIQHPTLAARDAYAARGGWHSERYMSAITYHTRFGEVGRVTVSPDMLREAA